MWLVKAELMFWYPLQKTHMKIITFPLGTERKILQSYCCYCLMIFTISTLSPRQNCLASSALIGGHVRIIHIYMNFSYNLHQALKTEILNIFKFLSSFKKIKVAYCQN